MYEDPNFRPSAAEIVMVHMVFAIMFFQWASRNWAAPTAAEANHRSNMHYHHSLTFYGQLLASRKLVDIQALALICSHMRNFPKPSASWVVTASTFNVALEAGLHRSVKRHGPTTPPTTPPTNMIEIEMRKRVFYSLLAIHVSLSGKLGRPMPLRNEDFDVELPVAVDDDLITEEGIDRSRPGRCKILIGIEVFKAAIIFIDMFSTMYSARRDPSCYRHDVHRFEAKIAQWRDQWPSELVNVEAPVSEGDDDCSHFALYLQLWEHEFRMLVRHPSLSATRDPDFNRENIDSCLEAARGMMKTLMQVQEMKSLDTTWYNAAVYMMALMVMLYAHWYRRSELTPAALAKLREEMEDWVTIMGDVGLQIGMSVSEGMLGRAATDRRPPRLWYTSSGRRPRNHRRRHGSDGPRPAHQGGRTTRSAERPRPRPVAWALALQLQRPGLSDQLPRLGRRHERLDDRVWTRQRISPGRRRRPEQHRPDNLPADRGLLLPRPVGICLGIGSLVVSSGRRRLHRHRLSSPGRIPRDEHDDGRRSRQRSHGRSRRSAAE